MFAADLIVSNGHPWVGDGDVEAWPGILRRIAEVEPEKIVPGHGDVTGLQIVEFMLGYLEALAAAKPGDANPFPALPYPELWDRNLQSPAVTS